MCDFKSLLKSSAMRLQSRQPRRTCSDIGFRRTVFLTVVITAAVACVCNGQIPTNLQSCVSTSSKQVCVPPTFDPVDSLSTTISATSTCGMSGTILEFCSVDRTDNSSGCVHCRSSTEYMPDRVRTRASEFERWQSATLPTIETAENLTATFATGYIVLSITIEFPVSFDKPSEMMIQGQSADGWRSWLHLSRDCSTSPHRSSVSGIHVPCRNFDLTTNVESYTRTTISAFNASLTSEADRATFINQYGGQSGVRLAFLRGRYNDLVRADDKHLSAFYSVTHLVVDALCDCNGHASACNANGVCSCQHETEGPSCERCIPQRGQYRPATYVPESADVCNRDISPCANSPCQNGGTCVAGIKNYLCNCPAGFTGQHCMTRIDNCASSPCHNGATCVGSINNYTCNCTPGFTGQRCTTNIDECASSPCSSEGTCMDLVNGYACSCTAGFTGRLCETDIDKCSAVSCANNGTCQDGVALFTCHCTELYTGKMCEIAITQTLPTPGGASSDGSNDTYLYVGIAVAILILLLVLLLLLYWRRKRMGSFMVSPSSSNRKNKYDKIRYLYRSKVGSTVACEEDTTAMANVSALSKEHLLV